MGNKRSRQGWMSAIVNVCFLKKQVVGTYRFKSTISYQIIWRRCSFPHTIALKESIQRAAYWVKIHFWKICFPKTFLMTVRSSCRIVVYYVYKWVLPKTLWLTFPKLFRKRKNIWSTLVIFFWFTFRYLVQLIFALCCISFFS